MNAIITALASFGMSGEVFHAPLITSNPHFRLKTILQRSSDSAKIVYPEVTIVKNFDEILDDPEINLVVINTPNTLHYPMCKAALEANKNVVVEKPFTVTSAEATELIKLAASKKLLLSVFHNKRLENDFLTIKKIIDQHLVGRIVELEWHYDRFRTHITHKQWKEGNHPGAGTLYDLGVHLVDSALCLFGKPQAITADIRILRDGAGAPDYFNLRLDYDDKRVILRSSTMVRESGPSITLHGDKGSFVKYGSDPQEHQLKTGIRPDMKDWGKDSEENYGWLHTEKDGRVIREKVVSETGAYEKFYQNIAEALHNKSSLMVTPEEALEAVRIVELAEQSNQLKKTISLN